MRGGAKQDDDDDALQKNLQQLTSAWFKTVFIDEECRYLLLLLDSLL